MAGVNNVILLGRLGQDPEVRYTPDGKAVATLSLATSESYKDKNGERQERTEWHRIILWERKAEVAQEYLRKGDQTYIEGSIRTRKWTDKNGEDRYSTEIIGSKLQLLGSKKDESRGGSAGAGHPAQGVNHSGYSAASAGPAPTPEDDYDIPFATNADMDNIDNHRRSLLARVRF